MNRKAFRLSTLVILGWLSLLSGGLVPAQTPGYIPLWLDNLSQGDSAMSQNGQQIVLQTDTASYGFLHTDGDVVVGSWVGTGSSGSGGWLGTRSNHPLQFFTADGPTRMTIDTAGNVGIGTISPSQRLDVNGTINYSGLLGKLDVSENMAVTLRAADFLFGHSQRRGSPGRALVDFREVGTNRTELVLNFGQDWFATTIDGEHTNILGFLGIGIRNLDFPQRLVLPNNTSGRGLANAWQTYSSRRWKENITPIDNALAKVERLRGVYYDWKETQKHDLGLIAEEVGEVIPEVVTYEANGQDAQSVDYARLTALLVEAVKELKAENEALRRRMEELWCQAR